MADYPIGVGDPESIRGPLGAGCRSDIMAAPLPEEKSAPEEPVIELTREQAKALRNRIAFELFDDEGCVGADPGRFGGRREADKVAQLLAVAVRQALELPGAQPSTWRQASY